MSAASRSTRSELRRLPRRDPGTPGDQRHRAAAHAVEQRDHLRYMVIFSPEAPRGPRRQLHGMLSAINPLLTDSIRSVATAM